MIIPDELQSEEDTVLAKIRAGEKIDHFETVRQRKDGTRISISLTVSPIRDETGKVVGASKIARDVTERVRLEAAAREQAANTATLGEMGALVASTLDRQAITLRVTDVATSLTHAQWGAFVYSERDGESGDEFMQYCGVPRAAGCRGAVPSVARRRGVCTRPSAATALRLDDVTADPRYEHRGSPLKTADDLQVRSLLALPVKGVSRDVLGVLFFGHSQPARFTEQHERLAAGIAAWASIALENARLFDEAKRGEPPEGRVSGHALSRAPDAAECHRRIRPAAARRRPLEAESGTWPRDPRAQRDLAHADHRGRARRLTHRLRKIRLDVQPVDLSLIVENAVATVQPAADAKGIRVQIDRGSAGGPRVRRSRTIAASRLEPALERGEIHPEAGPRAGRVERVNSHVEIIVSDTGVGIRPDFLPYVFERFRQADAGTTRKSGGLGLGLAIVRHIVEMHGGSVEASSAGEDQGATFTVQLPLMIVYPQRIVAPREHPRTERRAPVLELADLSGVHVLAIDDEEDALVLMREILEAAGATVTTLGTPVGAIERIEAARPDVLVVDLGMPEIDGFDLIARIRSSANPAVRDVPATALTAFARAEDRTKALRSGFEMHLAKPVDPGELVASIATLARRARSSR